MVSDAESFAAARRVTAEEGLLIGGSCGTAVHAALVVGARARARRGRGGAAARLRSQLPVEDLRRQLDDPLRLPAQRGPDRGRRARGEGRLDPRPRGDHAPTRRRATRSRACARSACRSSWSPPPPSCRWRRRRCRAMLSELPLMDKAFRDPARARPPGGRRDGAGAAHARRRRDASPTSSSGSSRCTAVLVLDGGHPVGVLTRSGRVHVPGRAGAARKDSMSDGFETRAIHDGQAPDPATGAVVPPISLSSTFVARRRSAEHAGLRVRPQRQPHARARTRSAWRRSRARRTASRSRAAWRRRTRCCACSRPAQRVMHPRRRLRRHVPPGVEGARARRASSGRVADLTDLDALRARLARRHRAGVGRDAHQPRAHHRRHRSACARLAHAARRARRRRQHVRDARTCSGRSSSAPTSSCTRPRSTSAVTPTSSAGSRPPTIPRSPSASGSCRTRSARCRARSTATSCCAGIKTLAVRMERHCCERAGGRHDARSSIRRCRRVLYPGSPTIPATRSRARQMRDFGGMVSFLAVRRRGDRARARRPHPAVHAGGVARRRRVAHRAPGPHDARVGGRLASSRSIPRSSACRSASRPPTTSSPTSTRPSNAVSNGDSLTPLTEHVSIGCVRGTSNDTCSRGRASRGRGG